MMLDDDSTIFMLPPSPPESRLVPDFGPRSELLAQHDNFASTPAESIGDEVVVANMDGPDPDSGTCCFGARQFLLNGLAHI